jgi:hypothetical protein
MPIRTDSPPDRQPLSIAKTDGQGLAGHGPKAHEKFDKIRNKRIIVPI